jgi:hypothetical protein
MAGGTFQWVRLQIRPLSTNHDQIEALRKMQHQTELRTANSCSNPAETTAPDVNQVRASPFDVAQSHSRCHS